MGNTTLICSVLIILLVKFTQKSFKDLVGLYNMSFNEGNVTNSLNIFKERIDFVEQDDLSNSIIDIKNQDFTYRLSFENRKI